MRSKRKRENHNENYLKRAISGFEKALGDDPSDARIRAALEHCKGEFKLLQTIPEIHYPWIGPPSQKGDSGHDVAGILAMAKVNQINPLHFWCLEAHVSYYEKYFNGTSITVVGIETYLKEISKTAKWGDAASFVLAIGQRLLGWGQDPATFYRDTIRDRVSFKNLLALFILMVMGGYVMDSNVHPESQQKNFNLPFYPYCYVPKLSKQLEMWMMCAPENHAVPKEIFNEVKKNWMPVLERIFEDAGGYTEQYYHYCSILILNAIKKFENRLNTWKIEFYKGDISLGCLNKELELKKFYDNTHKMDQRPKFDDPTKLLWNGLGLWGKKAKMSQGISDIVFSYVAPLASGLGSVAI